MTIKALTEIRNKLSLSQICKESGLDYLRINNKIKNQSELTVIESHLLENVFENMYNVIKAKQ